MTDQFTKEGGQEEEEEDHPIPLPLWQGTTFHEYRYESPEVIKNVEIVSARLGHALTSAIGDDFASTWHLGLPNCSDAVQGTQIGNIVWLNNVVKAFGILDFARDRYGTLVGKMGLQQDKG